VVICDVDITTSPRPLRRATTSLAMKRSVAEYLEPRLCPDAIMVGLTVVPADAIALLRAGMVWSLSYDAGRLLGEVSSLDLHHLQFKLDQPNLRDYGEDRHRVFTREQFAAIAAFADYYHCTDEDRARWHALARGGAWPPARGESDDRDR